MAFDMSELQGLLAQFAPTEDEKRQAQLRGIAQFGLGLLGTQKGDEFNRLGAAGAYGLNSQADALSQARQGKMQGMQAAGQAMELQQRMQQQKAAEAQAGRDAEWQKQLPALFGGASPAAQVGSGSPTPENVAAIPKAPAKWQVYQNAAEKAAQAGRTKEAEQYAKWAEQYKPEVKSQEVRLEGDQPVVVITYKDGSQEKSAFNPTPDTQMVNLGDKYQAVDKNRVPAGASFAIGQSADSKASTGLGYSRLAFDKQKDAREQGQGGKPQLVDGQWVYPPSADAPSGRAVAVDGFTKPDKPLTESQAKATAFVNQMQSASQTLAELEKKGFTGKGVGQQAAIVSAGAEGVPYVPGSAAIPRMISGPQAQKFQQAEMVWTEAALRFMTGANAPESEVRRNADTFFPRPGDDDAKIAQKAAARKNMEQSVSMAAGKHNTKKTVKFEDLP